MRFSFARDAETDLDEIWIYFGERNIAKAQRTVEAIQERCLLLLDNPNLGRARPELNVNYRSLVIGDYVIYYRFHNQHVQIYRILHSSRDLSTLVWLDDDSSLPS